MKGVVSLVGAKSHELAIHDHGLTGPEIRGVERLEHAETLNLAAEPEVDDLEGGEVFDGL